MTDTQTGGLKGQIVDVQLHGGRGSGQIVIVIVPDQNAQVVFLQ